MTIFHTLDALEVVHILVARGDTGRSSRIRFVFQTEILGKFVKIYIFCFILLFTSSLPCDKDQFAVS